MRRVLLLAGVVLTLGASSVSAHTITYGYTAGANPGDVNFWFGSYHIQGDGPDLEGSLQLTGVNGTLYPTTTTAFTTATTTLPTGLTAGTNYFIDPSYSTTAFGNVAKWQGVTVTGLVAGDYTFTYLAPPNVTVSWAPWSSNIGSTFTLTSGYTEGGGENLAAPEPTTLALMGLGGIGLIGGAARKRRKTTTAA